MRFVGGNGGFDAVIVITLAVIGQQFQIPDSRVIHASDGMHTASVVKVDQKRPGPVRNFLQSFHLSFTERQRQDDDFRVLADLLSHLLKNIKG